MDTTTESIPEEKVQPADEKEPVQSPEAFYDKLIKRTDVRELLCKLADVDKQ